ncbi:MAG: APC family permease [Agrococcus casei]|uniref:Putative amino acid transporter n=1 Tax=Agrococcus casei LMG 22410 TaxID=1255656 RepID=A0A1R4F4H5_9MICO|nr:APC family permease [Agrococcus casei]SJM50796.1 putative amino acid transporter [Agrococcus casei LMG 22410]
MTELKRTVGVAGAAAIGISAMVGAGLFFVWSPAASLAGDLLWAALLLAALIAVLNALSSAQLAMEHPVSGGAYAYGRSEVSPWVGFSAGWMFLTGKTFSAAAMASIAARHISQDAAVAWTVVTIMALSVINILGMRVTTAVSKVIVVITVTIIAIALGWAFSGAESTLTTASTAATFVPEGTDQFELEGLGGLAVLQATGLLFFAFAGYARMATLGGEVVEPRKTLPRAILGALAFVLVIYGLLALATSMRLGDDLPESVTPVADLVGNPILHQVVMLGAVIACLGSLLGILAGLSRTALAMAHGRDMPGILGAVNRRTKTPIIAELVVMALAIVVAVLLPASAMVAVSSTFVLGYYAIAHWSAIRMRARFAQEGRRMWLPSWVPWVGIVACLLIVVTLSWVAVLIAVGWVLLGLFFWRGLAPVHRG